MIFTIFDERIVKKGSKPTVLYNFEPLERPRLKRAVLGTAAPIAALYPEVWTVPESWPHLNPAAPEALEIEKGPLH